MLGAASCAEQAVTLPEPVTQARTERRSWPVPATLQLDLLIVVDTSPLMQGMRSNLASQASTIANMLNSMPGGMPDLHIAVISSDMGTAGGTNAAGCSSLGDNAAFYTGGQQFSDGKAFLADHQRWGGVAGQRTQNYQGTFAEALAGMLTMPPSTCRYAQPMRAISQALSPRAGNASGADTAGFIRAYSQLAVIVISANDDCSLAPDFLSQQIPDSEATAFRCFANSIACDEAATTVGPHHNCRPEAKAGALSSTMLFDQLVELLGVRRVQRGLTISLITGGGQDEPSVVVGPTANAGMLEMTAACAYMAGASSVVASPSVRLTEFAKRFRYSLETTICKDDISDALTIVGIGHTQTLFAVCSDGNYVQPFDCAFTEYRDYDTPQQQQQLLPQCDATKSNTPCVHLVIDPATCPVPSTGIRASFEPGTSQVFPGTFVGLECVTTD